MGLLEPSGLRRWRRSLVLLLKCILVLTAAGLYIGCVFSFYPTAIFWFWGNFILALVYAIVLVALGSSYDAFAVGILRIRELIASFTLAVLITNAANYLVLSLISDYMLPPWGILLLTLAEFLFCIPYYWLANRIYFFLNPARDCVVICARSEEDKAIVAKFALQTKRYLVRQIYFFDEPPELLRAGIDDHSVVILGTLPPQLRLALSEYCYERDKRLFLVPGVQDIMMNSAYPTQIGDSLVYLCRARSLSIEQLAVKRAMDIVFSLAALIVLSPLLLITALAIKLGDGGSVLYSQTRLTKDERPFTLYKFRSMRENAEANGVALLAARDDERITPVGRFLRASRMDELPQLWNILRGDMSLVGPRPERPEFATEFSAHYPQFRYRYRVKAGLTGYAQVNGDYDTPVAEKVKMDLAYIERWSPLLDLLLIFATVKVLFVSDKAKGKLPEALAARLPGHEEDPRLP